MSVSRFDTVFCPFALNATALACRGEVYGTCGDTYIFFVLQNGRRTNNKIVRSSRRPPTPPPDREREETRRNRITIGSRRHPEDRTRTAVVPLLYTRCARACYRPGTAAAGACTSPIAFGAPTQSIVELRFSFLFFFQSFSRPCPFYTQSAETETRAR